MTVPPYDKTVKGAWIPNAWNAKTAAGALDVDAKGNLLVCDLANQAIVELSAEGKQLSATPVAWPDRVIVSHKTDALYVVSKKFVESSGGEGEPALFKITGRGEKATVAAKLPLRGRTGTAITLDESGEKPVLWLAGGDDLVRVEDRGTELAVTGQNLLNRDPNAVGFVRLHGRRPRRGTACTSPAPARTSGAITARRARVACSNLRPSISPSAPRA